MLMAYDGGTKEMNLEALREIRRSFGTLDAGWNVL